MKLKERIEILEKLEKQRSCNHSIYSPIEVSPDRVAITNTGIVNVKHTCLWCGRISTHIGCGKELMAADKLLRDFVLEVKKVS